MDFIQSEITHLHNGEDVNSVSFDVAQIDVIWLVFLGHENDQHSLYKLKHNSNHYLNAAI